MNLLDDARKEISAADKIIAEQFEKRMHAVENVAKYKNEHSLPVFDAGREDALIKKNLGYISDSNIRDLYILFQKQVMEISKKYQYPLEKIIQRKKDSKSDQTDEISQKISRLCNSDHSTSVSSGILRPLSSGLHIQNCQCRNPAERYRRQCTRKNQKDLNGQSSAVYG